ncbi:Glucose-repressible alcohol dehydrogenase transcriptional effector, partial [Dispira parvispora]
RLKEDGGYTGAFWPKSRARTMTDQERKWVDGCVIFYKESKFNLRESHVFEFQQSAMQQEDFKKSAVAFDRFFTKDNIAAFMVLEHKVKGTPLLVANCHIHWNPEYTDVKVVQVAMLMEEIERLTARYGSSTSKSSGTMRTSGKASTMGKSNGDGTPYLSTILCGDFNSTPDSGVVEYITRGTLPKDHADLIKCTYSKFATKGFLHSLSLKSAYGAVGELPLTNFSPSFRDVIDYIYYSDGTLTPTGLLGAVDPDYLDRVVGFPTPDIPSDHICLMSQFKWKSSPSTTTATTTRSVSSGASSTAFGTTRMGGVGSSFTFNRPHSESSAPGSPSSQFRKTTSSLGKK